jgi:hypothetical protein
MMPFYGERLPLVPAMPVPTGRWRALKKINQQNNGLSDAAGTARLGRLRGLTENRQPVSKRQTADTPNGLGAVSG